MRKRYRVSGDVRRAEIIELALENLDHVAEEVHAALKLSGEEDFVVDWVVELDEDGNEIALTTYLE